jgi:hypothetical protein
MSSDWRAVVGYEGHYEVSRSGLVRSLDRHDAAGHRILGRLMKSRADKDGYPCLTLTLGQRRKSLKVHRLVLEAFCGPCPYGMEAGHLDGDPSNASIDNLKWITGKENMAHRDHVHNTQARGQSSPRSKLTQEDVLRIRESSIFGATVDDLSSVYGVSPNTIYKIRDRSRWAGL